MHERCAATPWRCAAASATSREFATPRLLRDAHLGSIWEGTGNIVALDALTRAVGRHGADAALAADLHAKIDDMTGVPQGWRDRLRSLSDKAIGFAGQVARDSDNEADARRATSALYHVASAVTFAWEGGRLYETRGDAKRMLLSKLVVEQRLAPNDPFALTAGKGEDSLSDMILGEHDVSLADATPALAI